MSMSSTIKFQIGVMDAGHELKVEETDDRGAVRAAVVDRR